MQRLTEKADEYFHKSGIKYYPKDKGLNKSICNKLGEYEDLEEQGLLLRLPCKVGDTVYLVRTYGRSDITKKAMWRIEEILFTVLWLDEIGEIVFLTKEEAEAKLREMEAGK